VDVKERKTAMCVLKPFLMNRNSFDLQGELPTPEGGFLSRSTEQLSELQFFEVLTRTPEYTISVTRN
jgi:hypothetical protein